MLIYLRYLLQTNYDLWDITEIQKGSLSIFSQFGVELIQLFVPHH